jgi:predicted heme/steroid binding protein
VLKGKCFACVALSVGLAGIAHAQYPTYELAGETYTAYTSNPNVIAALNAAAADLAASSISGQTITIHSEVLRVSTNYIWQGGTAFSQGVTYCDDGWECGPTLDSILKKHPPAGS